MKTKLNLSLKLTFTILAFTFTSVAFAGAPPWVKIRSISYAGSGCPAGTVAENIAPDFKAFTLLFDDYIAEVGPGLSYRAGRMNCTINIDLDFPQGWSYTLVDVDYRGFASLDRRVNATQKSVYYFQGSRHNAVMASTIRGPFEDDYHFHDRLGLSALVWSPCGMKRSLNVISQVRVNNRRNRRGMGVITVDSIDGQLTHVYGIQWKRCRR